MSERNLYPKLEAIIVATILGALAVILLMMSVPPPEWVKRSAYESICTMDADQAREFSRMCEAEGGEIRIHEYTCTKE